MARNRKYSYVYLVGTEMDNPVYKIGYASNVKSRIASLQTGCPCPLRLIKSIRTHTPRKIEASIHRALEDYRLVGEWFNAPLDMIIDAMETFGENETFLRWCYVFGKLGVEYSIVDDKTIRLANENARFILADYEPTEKEMIQIGDSSSTSKQVHVVITSMPYVTKKRIGYLSSLFVHVFAGSIFDVYDCALCDMDFSRYSKREFHPKYGRYRFLRRAAIYLEDGALRISGQSNHITDEFCSICNDAMKIDIEEIRDIVYA